MLSDGQKRAAYDRFGHQGVSSAAGAGFDATNFPDLGDILNDMFGFGDVFGSNARQRRTRPQRGEDLRYDLEISFEDSMRGMTADIQVPRMEECARCKGKGAEPDDGLTTCPTCRGRGEVIYQQAFLPGPPSLYAVRRPRPDRPPPVQGVSRRSLFAPRAQAESEHPGRRGQRHPMRLSQGQPGSNGGPPGDLFVVLKVAEHPIFERHEFDLHCTVPINIAQAALGTTVDLLTFDGLQTVKVPEGAQPGSRVRLKNLGVPRLSASGRGDLYVHLDVIVPAKLTRDQRRLFEQLRELLPAENEPSEKGILDKVKDYFM